MIELIAHKVTKMESSIEKLAEAITKLAVIEERQMADRVALERAFQAIQKTDERSMEAMEKLMAKLEKDEGRIDVLEQAAPVNAQTSQWVQQALWGAASVACVVALSKLGMLG